ncbi:hypothetical protein CJF42_12090 [Pseudoalteromonas sp. NBT06-2]|uniref:O-antigen ligase family protein n=1 Tax=Pseudoalteromonas sp. NBT06-2 TaxID=2025950 RepID=UPI000BA53739|nr:O-antigen ligase family protein [Pseudoalteromonas sp. NBT06-2]PAJ74134.1 hypothetical protein CJF42_12090 [Pseudoalteromonas sp. NBT06-2]
MPAIVIAKYVFSLFILIFICLIMRNWNAKISKGELYFVVLFTAILVHSIAFSHEIENSVERSLFSLSFVFMLLSLRVSFGQKLLDWLKNFLVVFAIIVTLISDIILVLFGNSSRFYIEGNFTSIFSNANNFGLLVSVFLLPAAISFFASKKRKVTWKSAGMLCLVFNLLFILIETRSRASLGVVLFIISVFILIKYKKSSSRVAIGVTAFVVLMPIIISLQETLLNKYQSSGQIENNIFSTRMILWIHRIEGIQEKPLIGWGYQVNSAKNKFFGPYKFNELEKGNTPLALLEEFGVIFGGLVIFSLYSLVYKFLSLKKQYSLIPLLVTPALAHSMFETWLFNFNGYYAWILWGCIFLGCSFLSKQRIEEKHRIAKSKLEELNHR